METSELRNHLIEKRYIPWDKSWLIRLGILDLLNYQDGIIVFLEKHKDEISEDLLSLSDAIKSWKTGEYDIDVGESATLYRFLRFTSWKLGRETRFISRGTLVDRKICDNPDIINYPLTELLKLDNGTSQWASAAVLLGNREAVVDPPFKLALTYEAVAHWNKQRAKCRRWKSRYDETILRQAVTFIKM
ncbi:MAG: hypothetical protein Q7S70_02450, partial [bacterium]|nr:hypothetical protein [bacterium]